MSYFIDYNQYDHYSGGVCYSAKQPSGFIDNKKPGTVKKITCTATLPYEEFRTTHPQETQNILVRQFANDVCYELINDPRYFHSIHKITNHHDLSIKYEASIFIAQCPHDKYINMLGKEFTVDGQSFSNDELVRAVKNSFPERFI